MNLVSVFFGAMGFEDRDGRIGNQKNRTDGNNQQWRVTLNTWSDKINPQLRLVGGTSNAWNPYSNLLLMNPCNIYPEFPQCIHHLPKGPYELVQTENINILKNKNKRFCIEDN